MTIEQLLRTDPFFVGFERIANQVNAASKLAVQQKYPPYNIIKSDENTYIVELAVAGFSDEELDIELHDGILTIKGDNISEDKQENYIFKGIANRGFERRFTLADTVQVEEVTLEQGILTIKLKNIIPEERKPRKIQINSLDKRQLLNE